jgi:hypothetical protein
MLLDTEGRIQTSRPDDNRLLNFDEGTHQYVTGGFGDRDVFERR